VTKQLRQKGGFVADPQLLDQLLAPNRTNPQQSLEAWRRSHPGVPPDLTGADLRRVSLRFTDLSNAKLLGADLSGLDLTGIKLDGADLSRSTLRGCSFGDEALNVSTSCKSANFQDADLTQADFCRVLCDGSNFTGATLRNITIKWTRLNGCRFVGADWDGASISECHAYGISVWGMRGTPAKLSSFNIVATDWPQVRVDDLETAQLVHLFLESDKVRKLFESIGSKGVLVLGRFSEERKRLLDAIRSRLRELGFLPLVFDFQKPSQYDFTETVRTLAGLSCFIIADITEPRSVPLELQATIPNYMIPFAPILREGERPFAMFLDLQQKYRDWMLDLLTYRSDEELLEVLEDAVIAPALALAAELRARKSESVRTRRAQDVRRKGHGEQ
jgi:hypothetical protein